MASYKNIHGFTVQNLDEDPSTTSSVGQIYYNASTGQFKSVTEGGAPIGSWSTGGALNTRRSGLSAFGASNSSSIATGGSSPGPSGTYEDVVEQYNGTSWTEIAEFTTARNQHGSFGSTTAGLICGGIVSLNTATSSTQTWNGSSWTEVNELNTAKSYNATGGNGTQTAGLISVGWTGTATTYTVESWDGTNWTEVAEPNGSIYLRASMSLAPNTDSLLFGGGYPRSTTTETWNGSAWTEVSDLNTARADMGGAGTATDGIGFGGRSNAATSGSVLTEFWNGTSWTEIADQGVSTIFYFADTGSGTSGMKIGGATVDPPNNDLSNVVEEWTAAEFQIKTLTTS